MKKLMFDSCFLLTEATDMFALWKTVSITVSVVQYDSVKVTSEGTCVSTADVVGYVHK